MHTELMFATQAGDIANVRRLCVAGAEINTADYDGRTPLHIAASEGHVDVVKHLVKLGARLDPVDRWGGTPLDDAVRGNKQEVMRVLQEKMREASTSKRRS
eukprot:Opistho-2@61925